MELLTILIILANVLCSYKGFKDPSFQRRYALDVDAVLIRKEYYRLVTSGFLHTGWFHLIFNMITLYAFGQSLMLFIGTPLFALIYFAGLIGGNLFGLLLHRNHGDFGSIGASGAVCGVLFATIALFPGMDIRFFLIPIPIPAWFYGFVYICYTIWGIRSKHDNVGHEAHLAGALTGMLLAIAFYPQSLRQNLLPILAVAVPCIVFIYVIVRKPHLLLINNNFFNQERERRLSIDQRYNARRIDEQKELDAILEKIHRKGMNSLSKGEKEALERYSRILK